MCQFLFFNESKSYHNQFSKEILIKIIVYHGFYTNNKQQYGLYMYIYLAIFL